MTLLELTVVITVLLALILILFLGANAWKAGSDRTNCLINIRNVQLAGRSYQNSYAVNEGAEFKSTMVIGQNSFIADTPVCPAGGKYTFTTTFPATGVLFMTCDQNTHEPSSHSGW